MAIITFIMGLIVGWKGWKFFNKLICWTFILGCLFFTQKLPHNKLS